MKYAVEMTLGLETRNAVFDTREECARFLRTIRDATAHDPNWWDDMALDVATGVAVNRETLEVCDVMAFRMVQVPTVIGFTMEVE